jgi:molybdopterin-guanine dinucleotide biosynthesis protein A
MLLKNLLSIVFLVSIQTHLYAQRTTDEPFIIENYYKAKWGYAEEFISLYKKNHYPLLKKALEKGDLISIKADKPRQHASEDGRWDYRVTLVFKNAETAFDANLTEPYKKALYPDLEKLKKEEQRRFEILLAHWDVEVQSVDLEK